MYNENIKGRQRKHKYEFQTMFCEPSSPIPKVSCVYKKGPMKCEYTRREKSSNNSFDLIKQGKFKLNLLDRTI